MAIRRGFMFCIIFLLLFIIAVIAVFTFIALKCFNHTDVTPKDIIQPQEKDPERINRTILYIEPCILKGNGHDCYMIAVLQALFNLKNYRAAMEEIQPEQNTIEFILKSIYREMVKRRGKSMTIDGYRKKICNILNPFVTNESSEFEERKDNDAFSFLMTVLNAIKDKEMLKKYFLYTKEDRNQKNGRSEMNTFFDFIHLVQENRNHRSEFKKFFEDNKFIHIPKILTCVSFALGTTLDPDQLIHAGGKDYEFKSAVFFYFFGSRGHYFTVCKYASKFHIISSGKSNKANFNDVCVKNRLSFAFYEQR